MLGNWAEAAEANHRDRLWEKVNNKYLPAVLLVAALGGSVVTDPLKKLICSLLANLAFWGAVPADVQSLIAGILVLVPLSLFIWAVWRWFRRSGVKG